MAALKVKPDEPKLQPARWLWEGYTAAGSLTLLQGAPRVGKTTLTAALLACALRGGRLLGSVVSQARVLVVSEDSIEQRRQSLPGFDVDAPVCWLCSPARGRLPAGSLVQHIGDLVRVFAFDLVVIDPLPAFVTGSSLAPLLALMASGTALWLVHDAVDLSLTEHADIVLDLASGPARRRRLRISSRFAGALPAQTIELNEAGNSYRLVTEMEHRPPARVAPSPRRRRGAG